MTSLRDLIFLIALMVFSVNCFATTISKKPAIENDLNDVIQHTFWFEQGNPQAPHRLYVMAEPNCSACHALYENIAPDIESGKMSVRWILVAFLKSSSLPKAISILTAKNPAGAWNQNELNFNMETESGGILPDTVLSPQGKSAAEMILANNAWAKQNGFKSTPTILFETTTGKMVVLRGTPSAGFWPAYLREISH